MQISINIALQQLALLLDERVVRQYAISTGKKGVGEQRGSEQTPRGHHIVRAKIGANLPLNTVFKARRPTGEIYSAEYFGSELYHIRSKV